MIDWINMDSNMSCAPFCCYSVELATTENHAVKRQQHAKMMTRICKIMVLPRMQIYLDPMIFVVIWSLPFPKFWAIFIFTIHIWNIKSPSFILGQCGTFFVNSNHVSIVPVASFRHMSQIHPPVLCSFTGDTNLHLQPLQVDFFHTLGDGTSERQGAK